MNEFIMPNKIIDERLLSDEVIKQIVKLGRKALIVTGNSMIKLGHVETLTKKLEENGLVTTVFSEVTSEPTDMIVEKGLKIYKDEQCDMIVAFGGGSPIDAMKAIAVLSSSTKPISDYMNEIIIQNVCPMVAIPTTAGTGSETTQFTIITDTKREIKMLLKGPSLLPTLAIIDPFYTLSTPKTITAYTGLDALCHAIEAFTSKKAQELSSTYAKSAIKRIFDNLPKVYHDGNNYDARRQMLIASLEAGIAFNNSSVTIIHGMSRPIGALFHISHGLSNAVLMKDCLEFAIVDSYEKFAEIARFAGCADVTDSDMAASRKLIERIEELLMELNVPTLTKLGIDKEKFNDSILKMTQDALDSGSPMNTIREVTRENIEEIYRKVISI